MKTSMSRSLSRWALSIYAMSAVILGASVPAPAATLCEKAATTTAQRYWLRGTPGHCTSAGCVADVVGAGDESRAVLIEGRANDRPYATALCADLVEPNGAAPHAALGTVSTKLPDLQQSRR